MCHRREDHCCQFIAIFFIELNSIICRYSEGNALSEAATSSLPSTSSGAGSSSLVASASSGAKTPRGHGEAVGSQSKTLLGVLLTELMNRVVVMGGGRDSTLQAFCMNPTTAQPKRDFGKQR